MRVFSSLNKYYLPVLLFLSSGRHSVFAQSIPRLSPVPAKVAGVQQTRISLNGQWDFQVAGQGTKSSITVPGEWEMQGFNLSEGETALYSRPLDIPADWAGKKIKIRFDGISSHAVIKVNGCKVGEHEGSFVPFEADITAALRDKNNLLQVEVQALTISDRLACTSQYAAHTVGGILRKAVLFVLPETNIASISATTVFDKQYDNATLQIQTGVVNEPGYGQSASGQPSSGQPVSLASGGLPTASAASSIQLQYTIITPDGHTIAGKSSSVTRLPVSSGTTILRTNIAVKHPRQWNPEHPFLYQLTTTLLVNGKALQTQTQHLGFRQVEVKGNEVLVNGRPIKMHGVNRHSIYPLTGRSIDTDWDRKDAELLRQANCNYVRTSHYPPSEEFLNAADELGLFVESEASLCWISHGASPIWGNWDYTDEHFLPFMMQADVENVLAGRNHPSIIIWSLGNESRWSPLWAKCLSAVKALDPSRPTTFHDQCWGGYNNAGSQADIAVYHYPGINGPAAADTMRRPVLFGEYAHVSCYNRRELLTDPGIRSGYGKPLEKMYDSIYAHKGCLGGAIWSGIDDIFNMPDGRVVGYGPWGPIDAWRRLKPEYWGMKKAYSPVKVKKISWPSAGKKYIELMVENRYDFTSLQSIEIKAIVNGVPQTLKSDILPRSGGVIQIPAEHVQSFQISFIDPRGFVADEEKYENDPAPAITAREQVEVSLTENAAAYFVQQGGIRYEISKLTGIVSRVQRGATVIVDQGPVFCMVPMNEEDGGKPNVAGASYQNDIYPLKTYPLITLSATNLTTEKTDQGIKMTMDIRYQDNKGRQTYLFANDGKWVTEYEVHYTDANISPYQYGLMLKLPKTFDQLNWTRKGAFTTYPANDIARTEGTAFCAANGSTGIEDERVAPSGDWKDDANVMGSNDFRSTKHDIVHASLEDKQGDRVAVLSGSGQSSRSWFQDQRINWLIADYCNNGSEPFYGSPHTDGRIKIKEKILKGRLVLMVK